MELMKSHEKLEYLTIFFSLERSERDGEVVRLFENEGQTSLVLLENTEFGICRVTKAMNVLDPIKSKNVKKHVRTNLSDLFNT